MGSQQLKGCALAITWLSPSCSPLAYPLLCDAVVPLFQPHSWFSSRLHVRLCQEEMPERRTVGLRREEGIAPPVCFLFPSYYQSRVVPGTVTLARSLPCAGSGSYRRNQFAAFSRPAGSARHTEHTPTPHSSGSQPPGPLLQLASTHLRGLRLALREPPSQFPVLTIPTSPVILL